MAANGYGLPLQAVGAIVYAFRPPGSLDLQAVALEAIDGENGRVSFPNDAKRKACGQKKGAVFAVGIAGGDPLVIIEGEADALALSS